jgi:hypothetical protein
MAMLQATLASQLQNMTPTDQEATAITNLVNAYGTFASTAAAGAAVIPAANVNSGKAAMQAALTGMSQSGQAATKIGAAVQAFWVAAIVPPWPPAVSGVAPPNAGLAGLLATTFTNNTDGDLTLAQAANAVATDMYNQAIIGGLMNIPPPPAGTPTPIL